MPGKATLTARATDSKGRTQPTERDDDRRSYIVNHLLPIDVDVRPSLQLNIILLLALVLPTAFFCGGDRGA